MTTQNMRSIPMSELPDFLDFVLMICGQRAMLWGQPGVGKSEGVAAFALKHDGVLVDIRLSQYDSVDLRGFPGVDKATDLTRWHAPSTLPFVGNDAFPDDRPIILFLDEINAASQAVLAVAYQLINDGGIGEHRLKPNVYIVAAGNREGDKGVVNRMPLPLANRFTHVEVMVDVPSVCDYILASGRAPIGVAFLQFRKELVSTFDPARTDKAFATPRTIMKALDYYAETRGTYAAKAAAMAGVVGEGWATEFWAFEKIWQDIGPMMHAIRTKPDEAPLPKKTDLGMHYALAVAISGEMSVKTVPNLHRYLKRMEPEFVVLAWTLARKRDIEVDQTDEFMDFSKTYREIFRD